MASKEFDFTIGADPEFCCVDGRTLIESGAYTNDHDEFGCDGNGVTFEVRPEPSLDPVEVVSNIHGIFSRKIHSCKEFARFNWKAGSFYADCPLGGHIHFGIPARKIAAATCANVLDNYLGAISLLIEHKGQGLRRRQEERYGRPSDTRPKEWGFEYRTCSSWATSPYVAAAMLCLAKTVIYELLNNPKFQPRVFITLDDFTQMNTERIMTFFPDLWKDIMGMKLYQVYKPYFDLIYFLIKKGRTWFPSTPMKESWGLIDLSSAYENKIKMGLIWERFNQEVEDNNRVEVQRPVVHR